MINDKTLKQEGGDSSSNVQGQNIVIHNGLSYKDAKEIALDVFRDNFIQLRNEAAEIAEKRAEEIATKLFDKIISENPDALQGFKNPDMQDLLFTLQKQYAKNGDVEIGDILVNILAQRASTPSRDLVQIALDESVTVISRMTIEQINTVTVMFLLLRTCDRRINSMETLNDYIENVLTPFINKMAFSPASLSYLEFLGCVNQRQEALTGLSTLFSQGYTRLFQCGFTIEEFEENIGPIKKHMDILEPCFHDNQKWQFNILNPEMLENTHADRIDSVEMFHLKRLFNQKIMSDAIVKKTLIELNSSMLLLYEFWDNFNFSSFHVSSIGIAIAYANYRHKIDNEIELRIWIE